MGIVISGLFAHNLNVIVHSNAEANGTVYIGVNDQAIVDTGWGEACFINGISTFPFTVSNSYDLEDLQANAVGGTIWGAWDETTWQTGFTGNPPTIHLYLSFSYPKDISVDRVLKVV